jgi:membrane protein
LPSFAPIYTTPKDPFLTGPHVIVRSLSGFWNSFVPSLKFFARTEVHVYSFAVAANVLISFFPFLVAMLLLCRSVLHWNAAVEIILQTVANYFPKGFDVDFRGYLLTASYQKFSWLSVFLLLFTANGIFTPLEVALNHIWQVKANRSFLRNQVISLGLIFACGGLQLASISLTTINVAFLRTHFGATPLWAKIQVIAFQLFATPITMLMIFLVYWLLPNCKIRWTKLIPASAVVAIMLELSKYLNILTWPWLRDKLTKDVPPFVQSISIILWAFAGTMIILAGAEWSARVQVKRQETAGIDLSNPPAAIHNVTTQPDPLAVPVLPATP